MVTWPDVYSLPPDKLAKALALSRSGIGVEVGTAVFGFLLLVLALRFGWIARLRDLVVGLTPRRWLQGLCFIPPCVVLASAAQLPFDLWGHHESLAYGLSVQGWPSWFRDWALALLITVAIATPLGLGIFALLRKTPRHAWLWVWLFSIPFELLAIFASPYIIDPLFNRFEPLAQSQPALVEKLEQIIDKSGEQIPRSRMFLMKASDKSTTLNAYVTGFGASKRVVVWDTTTNSGSLDEVQFIFGHELGHYALGHIVRTLLFLSSLFLVALYAGARISARLIARYGGAWRISSLDDWAAAGIIALVFALIGFIGTPIANAYSRSHEHAADVYGQEIIHGIVAEPRRCASHTFQMLGEMSLDVPDPNPWWVWFASSHPSISERLHFAAHYDPWAAGEKPRYF